jgi:hypothetical protein
VRLVRRDARDAKELSWDPAAGAIDADGLAGVAGIVNLSGATIRRPGGYRLGRRAYETFAACWPNAPEEEQIIAEPQLENFDRETV